MSLPTNIMLFNIQDFMFYQLKLNMKTVLLISLLVSILSQTIIISPNSPSNTTQQTTTPGYTDVSVDTLDQLHIFIESIIRDAVVGLDNYLLVNVQQKISDSNTSNMLYLYTFGQISNQSNTSSPIVDNSSILSSFAVLGGTNNTQFIVYDGQDMSPVYTRSSNASYQKAITNNYSDINILQLNSDQLNAEYFIFQQVPKLVTWTLVSVKSQIVSGINYCFDFAADTTKSFIEEYCVWSQPWLNFLQLTLPDGTTITNNNNAISNSTATNYTTFP